MQIHIRSKGTIKAFWLFNNLPVNALYQHPNIVPIKDCWGYISGMKFVNQEGKLEYLIIVSYASNPDVLEYYKERWQIETMFKAFKTTGFNLESTHLTDTDRLDRLLMLLALAYCWAYKTGIYRHQHIKPIKIKKHKRAEKSLFAYGLEYLAQALINSFQSTIQKLSSSFLSCT